MFPHFGGNNSADVLELDVFIAFGIGLQVSTENMRRFFWIRQNIRAKVIPRFFHARKRLLRDYLYFQGAVLPLFGGVQQVKN